MKFTTAGLTVVIAALAIALTIKSCARPPEAKIPPALAKTLDSLDATRRPHEERRDSIIRIVVHDTIRSTGANARADTAIRAAVIAQREADSLAAIAATRSDSAALWRAAYEAQRRTSDSLRVAVASKDSAYRAEFAARAKLFIVLHDDSLRTRSIQDANDRLRKRIGELEMPCKIIGPIKCPSRTVTMLATTLTIVVVDAAARKD